MRNLVVAICLVALCGCSPSASQIFAKGMAAYHDKDYVTAYPLISVAAERGNVNAMAIRGVMHLFGQGTPVDGEKAQMWLRRASDTGFTDAQSTLGIMYATGAGVHRDVVEAKRLLKLAADKGDKHAIMMLKRLGAGGALPMPPALIL